MQKWTFASALTLLVACSSSQSPQSPDVQQQRLESRIGVISYWGTDSSLYNQLPTNGLALINPENGIFQGQTTTPVNNVSTFKGIVDTQNARGVKMLGYVPTGYFNHGCNQIGVCQTWARIEAQVQAYFQQMPNLKGIFFDEAAPSNWSCSAFVNEYQQLRNIVNKYRSGALIAFNAGIADTCVTSAVNADEIAVLFESDMNAYAAQAQNIINATNAAHARGALVWHLVHSVPTQTDMERVAEDIKNRNADYGYITNIGGNWQAGENTWGSLPVYWTRETQVLHGGTTTGGGGGVNWGNLSKKLVNSSSQLCLRGTGSVVDQQSCSSVSAWTLTYQNVSGHFYQLKYGSNCLYISSNNANTVNWGSCTQGDRQLFALQESAGLVYFTSKSNGHALTVNSNSAGAWLSAWPYSGAGTQKFYFQ
ncbi:spherulation-specific family 4 protein [Deinococcus cellulosilyticus]|uniref:Uncharacterized protein n=1 Tax=Deinococcus cellulosilyticus (strain DSM 18568 / NBRC 106333 / KACC 11606 / 5516J-15) TaxID=1223518 RepID=A0A511N368_DEIC1|nr:spherulation-specific family 4 protein [Deinococcus cellulosilyticus]GEM47304.1 hypothetical protein DC3_29390 [Deinococcus cellulosilyticus NBRC 106333 = KACC 11606]